MSMSCWCRDRARCVHPFDVISVFFRVVFFFFVFYGRVAYVRAYRQESNREVNEDMAGMERVCRPNGGLRFSRLFSGRLL